MHLTVAFDPRIRKFPSSIFFGLLFAGKKSGIMAVPEGGEFE